MISFFQRKNRVTDIEWLAVDMHSHLLPGIDDGAVNVEQSITFIKQLSEFGFSKLLSTPHIFTELYPNNPETIMSALKEVETALKQSNLAVEVFAAAEYMVDDTFKVAENLLCLPGKRILIEMSYLSEMPNIDHVIFELQLKGYQVILAHPERYNYYHKYPEKYQRFKDMGVLLQLNLLSLNGYYGKNVKRAAEYILEKKNYDLAATDLHHARHLNELRTSIHDGSLYKMIGNYPFKNKELFL